MNRVAGLMPTVTQSVNAAMVSDSKIGLLTKLVNRILVGRLKKKDLCVTIFAESSLTARRLVSVEEIISNRSPTQPDVSWTPA